MRMGLLVLSIVSGAGAAEPFDALKPMSFLAGSCWKGTFPDGKQTDEHCFQWLYEGKALRDTHTVRAVGRPDYVGETTYYWDSAARRVEYLYVENLGGITRGTMESAPPALVFPPAQYVEGGKTMTFRTRWTKLDEATYEVFAEMQDKSAWSPMFKLTMKRSGAAP